jgi:protein-S-isoprenylcysteine O-methyltransferase Ste14
MPIQHDLPAEIAACVVIACWVGVFVILVVGGRAAAKTATKREAKSHAGFLLQVVAYAITFVFPRTFFSPLLSMPLLAEGALFTLTMAMAVGSLWFCYAAARTLGKQWSLVARVIEGHELITEGPYAIVRNPIYLAMFGMLVATGLALSRWQALVAAIVLYFAGTAIRIWSEERLLRETFGAGFKDYAQRVPALFPRPR